MTRRYRPRELTADAIQWKGYEDNPALETLTGKPLETRWALPFIKTISGWQNIYSGWWIIRVGGRGIIACDPETFHTIWKPTESHPPQ